MSKSQLYSQKKLINQDYFKNNYDITKKYDVIDAKNLIEQTF